MRSFHRHFIGCQFVASDYLHFDGKYIEINATVWKWVDQLSDDSLMLRLLPSINSEPKSVFIIWNVSVVPSVSVLYFKEQWVLKQAQPIDLLYRMIYDRIKYVDLHSILDRKSSYSKFKSFDFCSDRRLLRTLLPNQIGNRTKKQNRKWIAIALEWRRNNSGNCELIWGTKLL